MRTSRVAFSLLIVAVAIATVFAQAPKPGAVKVTSSASATTTSGTSGTTTAAAEHNVQQTLQEILEEPTAPEAYHYDPQGRRDPFQSLIGPTPKLQPGQRPEGVPGLLIDELKLQGIVRTKQQGLIAMVAGPDNKSYLVHVGDKTLDGEVIRITPTQLVFRQEVNDPTRIERFREVVKDLIPESQKK
jgi:type IV pilus assembly protein PilP